MNEDKKDSYTSIADQVEKSVKEKSANAENFVRHALDSFEDFIFQLIAIRPKDYRPRDFTPTRDFIPRKDESKKETEDEFSDENQKKIEF